jgi:glucokinase
MTLGIDVGGTYLRYSLREEEKELAKASLKSADIGLCAFLEEMLQREKKIEKVCISYAGQVHNGVILSSPNITIDKHNIQEYIESEYGVVLYIANDLNCAVLAEAQVYNAQDICAVYVGTGLGLGVLSSSVLIKGDTGIATELGHIPYKKSPFICSCGKENCSELFCSGSGLLRWKKHYKLDENLTLQQLRESKNEDANKIADAFYEALLYALGSTITLFNPKTLVLGGGIVKSDVSIYTEINQRIKSYAMPLSLQKLNIVVSQLQNASLEGAFLLKDNTHV